jgi:hypothetical protein
LAPSLRVKLEHSSLPENFWEDLIFAKEEGDELSSANNFYDYFRGLYFKVEPLNADKGHLIQLDFSSSGADVKLHYTYQSTSPTTDETTERQGTYEMSFSGARINLFENDFNADIEQEIANANTQDGDELLYLKGGEGSMAVIELQKTKQVIISMILSLTLEIQMKMKLLSSASLMKPTSNFMWMNLQRPAKPSFQTEFLSTT